jgi:glycosyltransferase involved in cell wall biosynthesis
MIASANTDSVVAAPGSVRRVLYVNYEWDLREATGAGTHVTELAQNLRALGHEVVVSDRHRAVPGVSSARAPAGRAAVRGRLRAALATYLHEWAALGRAIRGVGVETTLIRRVRPDVVLTRHSLHQFSSLLAARRCGTPIVFEVNAPLAFEYRRYHAGQYRLVPAFGEWTEARTLAAADGVVVVSTVLERHLVERGVAADRITVVPNGVDSERFRPDVADRELRARLGDSVVVGFVGSFASFHGIDLLKLAATEVLPAHRQVSFLMVGGGPGARDLESHCAAHGVAAQVVFTGHVAREAVPALMAAADILVAPYPPEPLFYFSPIKLFEYMACGRAVLAARIGQIAEVVRDDDNGLLYDPADRNAFLAQLRRLVRDAGLRARLGRAARATVERDYTWRRNAERVAAALERAAVRWRAERT